MDGVPFETIAELKAEGHFSRFHSPARMVSTFPSLTNPAMVEILHHEDSPGYEDHFYDRERNRLLGTIQDRLQGQKFIAGTFRETFDYHAAAFKGALGYLAAPIGTATLSQIDLMEFRRAFEESDAPLFVGYIGETDSLAHLGGKEQLKTFLQTVDRTIEELIVDAEQHGGHLEVEMFSDHGNRYDSYKNVKLNDALAQAGFVTEKSITSERSVVLPKHGLVGASMMFTQPQNRARLAEVGAATTGVDFAAYLSEQGGADENTIELISRRGRARVRKDGERYKYEDAGGDPLKLTAIIEAMKNSGMMDASGFASEDDWFAATRDHDYVDPLRRLFDGFTKHVKTRADVIVSYEDGYLLGSPVLSYLAEMRATHGNLLRGETEGFAMSTRQELAPSVRGHELNRLFTLDQRTKVLSHFSGLGHCQLGPALARQLTGK
ncbi:MAG: alkaline phosphatase family protein [Acidobacteria bacterium]|nr:alkaline phosphatase family protein [Acidobacteriota bacterium]